MVDSFNSFLLPYAGNLIDQIGTRIMVVIATVGLAFSLVLLALSEWIIHYPKTESYIFVMGVISFSFMAVRFFGQGCLTMVSPGGEWKLV